MKHIVIGRNGPNCPGCGRPTEIRKHKRIGGKQLRGPFYYKQWFYCANDDCEITTYHTGDQFKVWNRDRLEYERVWTSRCKHCGSLVKRRRVYLEPRRRA
jgi:hypothetical protein